MPKIKRALMFVWDSAPILTTIKVILIIIQGLLPLAVLYLTKLVVDTVSHSLTALDKQAAFSQIMLLLAVAGGITLVKRGSIIESGTHSELMNLEGTYAHLFETQARNYR